MKFAANISTTFKEMVIFDRFNEAKAYGFDAVEVHWLYQHSIYELMEAREAAEISIILMNSPKNDPLCEISKRDSKLIGIATYPKRILDFKSSIVTAAKYCDFLKCPKLHIMAGEILENGSMEEYEDTYIKNLKLAADILDDYNIIGVIEPMYFPNYFLNSFEKAIKYIEEVDCDNMKLLLDVYHLHKIEGNVRNLPKYLPYAAHIQVSQAPRRNEPLSSGRIDYIQVFDILKQSNYNNYIGLEYTPSYEPNFEWLKNF